MYAKIQITGTIEVLTGMHIGGSSAFAAIGAVDSPVIKDARENIPMIPGSSLKGKMRTLLAKEINTVVACKPDDDDERITRLFGTAKGKQIDELNEIDEGFDALFKKVEKEITAHKENYLTEIATMQKLISAVSDLGLRIQALEAQNSERFKIYLASKRKQIHDYHVNSQTASRYYQNMANSHRPEQSYYFNEKQ